MFASATLSSARRRRQPLRRTAAHLSCLAPSAAEGTASHDPSVEAAFRTLAMAAISADPPGRPGCSARLHDTLLVEPPLAARAGGGAGPPPSPPLCDAPTGAREAMADTADLKGLRLGACDIGRRTHPSDGHCRRCKHTKAGGGRGGGKEASTQGQDARCAPPCCRIGRDRSLAVKRPAHVWYLVSRGPCASRSRCRTAEPARRHGLL